MEELAKTRLLKHFPDLTFQSLTSLHCSTNQVYLLETDSCNLIYRIFGQLDIVDRVSERENFEIVAAAGLGPKSLGGDAEYRFEEYIPGQTLSRQELINYAEAMAPYIAKFHDIPVPRGEAHLDRVNREWGQAFLSKSASWVVEGERRNLLDEVLWMTTEEAVREVRELSPCSPLVFSHNDLSYFNILKDGSHYTILDYEYAGGSYAAVDLAYYINEGMFDYCYPDYPGVRVCPEDEMSPNQIQRFVEVYAEARGQDSSKLLGEVIQCRAAVDFMGALWAANMAKASETGFDFLMYAKLRLDEYRRLRELVL